MATPQDGIERDVVVDGLRLHTRRRPGTTDTPLLLIHGIGGSMESWTPLLERLPDREVVMIDCPGVGRSERPRFPIRMPRIADLLVGALDELGVTRADVLGFSLGGVVAQEIAHRHPARVRRLVLVATICGLWVRPAGLTVQRALLSTERYRSREAAAREIPILAGGRTARDPDVLAAILADREGHPPSRLGYHFQQLAVLGWTSAPWLPRLRQQTLVLHGGEDPVVRVPNARLMAFLLRNATMEVVPGAGHMLLFDEPDKAAPILETFLASTPADVGHPLGDVDRARPAP
ncbi:alpha/beta hydrolase [Actinomycetospora endophytica]|uniref:Alpha/beta hydrolase n=1 Tax=Actinomycetospora endophytica TaxID=2291215 RepID=A0ABS8PKZ4_9PSEU|nr:alpha/beta hydrolase [Actinomycetospora endophytica]MCD2197649.1 alpha/beta hydrolase [Actinomycetospora endophytica]